jgi:L-malate glycosyltransferase
MRIVHFDTGQELRGGQHQLLLLARRLRERGHRQLIVCPDGSALVTRARSEGFKIFDLPAHDAMHAHGILQLRQLLRSEGADILHAHDGKGQTISWLASLGRNTRLRRVASRRVTFSPAHAWPTRFKYGYTCNGVIAVSENIKRLLLSAGVPERKVEVIPDGIELPADLPGIEVRVRTRAAWGFSEREFVAGHLGSFTPEKGQDIAVDAMACIAEALPRACLVLAGDCSGQANVFARRIRGQSGAAGGRVKLLGYVENLAEFFAGLDVYVMPSRAEGLGSSALMAMAHGLPVVASRRGGLPEIVEDGKTGWVVEPESSRLLAEALACAASDPARRSRFGFNARNRAREFPVSLMVDRTEAFYHRLTGRSSTPDSKANSPTLENRKTA